MYKKYSIELDIEGNNKKNIVLPSTEIVDSLVLKTNKNEENIKNKQDLLQEGENISIKNNVISSPKQETVRSLNIPKEKWIQDAGKFKITILPENLMIKPSSTCYIGVQSYDFQTKLWSRLPIYPKINNETGEIILENDTAIDCTIFANEGLILQPVPNPDIPEDKKKKIYGVNKVGRENPLGLPRTDDSVWLTYSLVEGTQGYQSDFDNCYPWSDITVVTEGENQFVRIPKFYHKYTLNQDGSYHIQISGYKFDDSWKTCFVNDGIEIDYVDIGKYENSGVDTIKSFSGEKINAIDIQNLRTYITNLNQTSGLKYHLFDIWDYEIIKLLFLVEFATTNSQSIMLGNVQSNFAVDTGSTDTLAQKTGTVIEKNNACKYREIENPWGNAYKYVDGININSDTQEIFISDNISDYQENKYDASYKKVGKFFNYLSEFSSIKTMKFCEEIPVSVPFIEEPFYEQNKYYCSILVTRGTSLVIGGSFYNIYNKEDLGLWHWYTMSVTNSPIFTRLCKKP